MTTTFALRRLRPSLRARIRRLGAGRRRRAGFSLVELIAAIMILAIGVLGLAATAGVVLRQMNGGSRQTLAASVAQRRLEKLSGRACRTIPLGVLRDSSWKKMGIFETWIVQATNESREVTYTVKFLRINKWKDTTFVYKSTIPCRDI